VMHVMMMEDEKNMLSQLRLLRLKLKWKLIEA
jgi:hypothetical protein